MLFCCFSQKIQSKFLKSFFKKALKTENLVDDFSPRDQIEKIPRKSSSAAKARRKKKEKISFREMFKEPYSAVSKQNLKIKPEQISKSTLKASQGFL